MKTVNDFPDFEGEFFARYTMTIPFERKLEIYVELCRVTQARGSPGIHDILDYLDTPEAELLLTMIGERFPIHDHELKNALIDFILSSGASGNKQHPS